MCPKKSHKTISLSGAIKTTKISKKIIFVFLPSIKSCEMKWTFSVPIQDVWAHLEEGAWQGEG
jgi:hypothetical protein